MITRETRLDHVLQVKAQPGRCLMTALSLHPLYTFTQSSLMAKELEEVDANAPLMFGPHLAEKSLWEKGPGSVRTHLYEHDEH